MLNLICLFAPCGVAVAPELIELGQTLLSPREYNNELCMCREVGPIMKCFDPKAIMLRQRLAVSSDCSHNRLTSPCVHNLIDTTLGKEKEKQQGGETAEGENK